MVVGVAAGFPIRLRHYKRRRAKRRCFQREIRQCGKLLRRAAQGIHAGPTHRPLPRIGKHCIKPRAKQGALPLNKQFRQL